MALLPTEKLKQEAEAERLRLSRGERPEPRLKNKLQRGAARALCAFFALVLVLTLVSRAADGVTVPRVEAEKPKTGILTQRFTADGTIEPQGDLTITLPGGIGVSRIVAEVGQQVQPGDTLLELDEAGLARTMEKLRSDIRLLDLKIEGADKGNTSASTAAILAAQQRLADAQEDYDRLVASRSRAEGRLGEDLTDLQAAYDKALSELEKAKAKAKEALIEAAQEKMDGAQKTLDGVKETAEAALESAQQSLTSAQDNQKKYNSQYYKDVNSLTEAREALSRARQALDDLIASGAATEEELQAAQDKVDSAQARVDAANWSLQSYDYSGDLDVKRAQESLNKVKEKQDAKVKAAEAELKETQTALEKAKTATDMSEEALVVSAQSGVDTAEKAIKTAQRGTEDAQVATEDQIFTAQRAIESAQREVEAARQKAEDERLSNQTSTRQAEIERLGYLSDRREQSRTLAELESAAASGGKVTAPVAGTVGYILPEIGKTQEGIKVATLSRADQGFTFSAEVAERAAEQLAVGDGGSITYTAEGKSQSLSADITALGAASAEGKVKVTVALPEGSYSSGGSAKFEITKRSQQYDSTLPLGALRSDSDGSYVLVLREKQTVMGLEQTVEKVAVEVLEQDSERAAVESTLMWDDRVVTSASKPVAEGDRVRLETE